MFSRASHAMPRAWLVLAAACWGLGTVLSKAALAHLPPLTLLVTQLIASLAVLWPVLLWQRAAVPWGRRPISGNFQPKIVSLGLLGWLNPGISYTLSLIGLSYSTASSSALLWAMEPLLIVGLAWLVLRERLRPGFLFVSGLAVTGALLVAGSDLGRPGLLAGNGLILAGVFCCALYTVLARRVGEGFSPLLAMTVQESLALGWALLIWPAELSRVKLESFGQIPAAAWGLAALSGVIYYGLAFWFYLGGLRRVSAGEAGFFINLVPIFALGAAYLLLSEKLAPVQWLGCGLALAAVFGLSLRRDPKGLLNH
jgi:drug/metabolite transporter (DMT)-like permease